MLPNELKEEIITLPQTEKHTIVIVTGKGLRHRRFALRILQEFGVQVSAWYELDSTVAPVYGKEDRKTVSTSTAASRPSKIQKVRGILLEELPQRVVKYGLADTLRRIGSLGNDLYYKLRFLRNGDKQMADAEAKLWGQEVDELRRTSNLKPIKIHPDDVHSEGFINEIKKLNPYFFLTLSGPLYRKPLLDSIRGAAINQHAGHSPLLKGSNTIHWALYHRELNHVSSTVHITTTGADSGQILRRSNPCMFPNDNVETVFLRTVALGTELMIESVQEIMADKKVMVFNQPKSVGKTYLNKVYNLPIAKAVVKDFNDGWLRGEINSQRSF